MNRWLLPINAAILVSIIAILALITADILSFRIARLFPPTAAKPAQQQAAGQSSDDLQSFAPILAKGLFGKATQGTLTPVVAKSAAKGQAQAFNQSDFALLGTVQGSFRESFALIQKISSKEERVFRIGDPVFTAGPLVTVKKEYVEILAGKARTKIFTPSAAPAAASSSPPPAGGAPAANPLAAQTSAGNYVIDQRSLNASLDNIGQAMTDARLLPSMKDGKVEGFRVSEIKPQGIFGTIGIRNGDVLLRMNDFPIDSPEKAMQSFASLKGQSRIRLDLIRDGQPTTFNYDIR
ncbi:MAG: type secretory pathway component PulC-like protein [Deltaproteobacteria bacterium]|nr:type secretory pathway component PulC-like protein [Deltaproteobacteria bacterium]